MFQFFFLSYSHCVFIMAIRPSTCGYSQIYSTFCNKNESMSTHLFKHLEVTVKKINVYLIYLNT